MHAPPAAANRTAWSSGAEHAEMQDSGMRHLGDAMPVTETPPPRGTRSDRSTGGEGSRRSGLLGAAAAMRSRLRRGRSGRDV